MTKNKTPRRVIVVVLVVLAAGVLAGGVIAAQRSGGGHEDVLALQAAIEQAPLTHVADIPAGEGASAQGVFVQLTRTGHVCVWEAPSASSRQRGGGCNRADDPLNGSALSATLSYDGGPAVETVKGATLFGLASADVASASVHMSDGGTRAIKLKKAKVGSDEFQAFGYRFKRFDLEKGIGPIAIVAYDASGEEIGRQPTGIGG